LVGSWGYGGAWFCTRQRLSLHDLGLTRGWNGSAIAAAGYAGEYNQEQDRQVNPPDCFFPVYIEPVGWMFHAN
jgi:hypothetical protein